MSQIAVSMLSTRIIGRETDFISITRTRNTAPIARILTLIISSVMVSIRS